MKYLLIFFLAFSYFINFSCISSPLKKQNEYLRNKCLFTDDEIKDTFNEFSRLLYEYLKKEHKLNRLIILNVQSNKYDNNKLNTIKLIIKQAFSKYNIKILEWDEYYKKNNVDSPYYTLNAKVNSYIRIIKNEAQCGKHYTISLKVNISRLVIWMENKFDGYYIK